MILSGSCNFSTILCSITFKIGFLSHWLWSEIRYELTVFYVGYFVIQKGPSMFVFISLSNIIWEISKSLEIQMNYYKTKMQGIGLNGLISKKMSKD